ncbi:GLPGLI family protein [Pontibacter cellulosilyticus]|uniref:GLPGLI family protein n=1 Tax=Pontibacter cellulosilyticus TaxID=1720253 RepID=A0A923N836_9BACT|nr:GLPGLI family protein [Pontibacter cellulosilyticus]MBC5994650.1 GLPGLI family protein [Pontibacter cellulosilyticus]
MKSTLTIVGTLVLMLVSQFTFAQEQGAITYETKLNMHRNIPAERAQMKDMIPEYRTVRNILTFNAAESLYKPLIDEQDDMAAASGGSGQFVMVRTPQNQTYINTSQDKRVLLREFMGKTYITQDSLSIMPWKFGDETKTIQGYTCKQAFYTDEKSGKTTVAWYTDKLRPNLGPDNFTSLPGAVLEIDFDNGLRVTRATKVDFKPLKKNDLVEPTKGEKVTNQQYQAMVEEQMKQCGNGNNFIIRN